MSGLGEAFKSYGRLSEKLQVLNVGALVPVCEGDPRLGFRIQGLGSWESAELTPPFIAVSASGYVPGVLRFCTRFVCLPRFMGLT